MYKQKRILSGVEFTALYVEIPIVLKKFLKKQTATQDTTFKDVILDCIFEKYNREYLQFLSDNKTAGVL